MLRQEKQNDKNKASGENIVAVYDLQVVLPIPKGNVSVFHYKRKLNCLNFTVTNLTTKQTESTGRRGSDEIGSCILKFINKKLSGVNDDSVINITFYTDNWGCQNKNKFIIALYVVLCA